MGDATAYRIEQGSDYQGDDWWKWWIWIEGSPSDLDRVEKVVYTLHASFQDPVRTVTSRATKFELKTAGWGVFRIRAKVHVRDGAIVSLSHYLKLTYPDGTETNA